MTIPILDVEFDIYEMLRTLLLSWYGALALFVVAAGAAFFLAIIFGSRPDRHG